MLGSLSIAKKVNFRTIVQTHQFKMLLISISVGVMAGVFIARVRLGMGMPGHKTFFWMTPVLIARLLSRCKIGTAAGGLSVALTTYALGGNLAGGLIGLPMIAIGGLIMDWVVEFLEKTKASSTMTILLIGLAGIITNLVCLAKRMMLPTGLSPHFIFDVSGFWFRLFSYMFFGFISGIIAGVTAKLLKHRQHSTRK